MHSPCITLSCAFNVVDFKYSTLNFIPINFFKSFAISTSKCDTFNMALLRNSPKSLWTSSTWVILKLETTKGQSAYRVSEPFSNFTVMNYNFHTLPFIPPHISPPLDSIISWQPPLFRTFTSSCQAFSLTIEMVVFA